MGTRAYVAIDLGAESGRVIVGSLSPDGAEASAQPRLELFEVHRFVHEPMAQCGGLDRRGCQFLLPAFRPVGLGDDRRHIVACADHMFESGDGEFGSSQKHRLYSHSPAFCILRILRLIRSRFKALR